MKCTAFQQIKPLDAWEHLKHHELVTDYGGAAHGHRLHTWDDGYRMLMRCKTCGGFYLLQASEFHGMEDDDYYTDYFPVDGPEEADELNRLYDGFEIEEKFPERWLMETNGSLCWSPS